MADHEECWKNSSQCKVKSTPVLLMFLNLVDDNFQLHYYWTYYITVLTLLMISGMIYYCLLLPTINIFALEDVGFSHLDTSKSKRRKTKTELVNEVRKRRRYGVVPPVYPNGWIPILESREVKTDQVKHVQALGENFAVLRTNKGKIHVLDAYCPHLGANMAVGGVVRGDCLECPFHGWQFRAEDGTCSHIPYSDKVPKSAQVKKWISSEVNYLIFVWYHAEGEPPSWHVDRIPQIESGEWKFAGSYEYTVNCHLQEVTENLADLIHFNTLHTAGVLAGGDSWWSSRLWASVMQHLWSARFKPNYGDGDDHTFSVSVDQLLQVFGKLKLLPMTVHLKQVGPGLAFIKHELCVNTIVTVTPLEPLLHKTVHYFYCPLLALPYAKLVLALQRKMADRDVVMWQHKKYVMKPLLCKEEESLSKHRRWYKQFYSINSPKYSSQHPLEW